MSVYIDDWSRVETMGKLYEEAFGPLLDTQEKAARVLHEKLKAIPGLTARGCDDDIINFVLEWRFRERKMERHYAAHIILHTSEYPDAPLDKDKEAKELFQKDRGASVLGMFFSQFGWEPNVRRWPQCQKCDGVDITIDVIKTDLYYSEHLGAYYLAYIPILEYKHSCPTRKK